MAKETSHQTSTLSAQDVANGFVEQYYLILNSSPELAHKFYKDVSIMGRPGPEGTMSSATSTKVINDDIMSFAYMDWNPDSVHAQDSVEGTVIVGVTGSLTATDGMKKIFTQTFFLAPQESGFYVHNDFIQFVDIKKPSLTLSVQDAATNTPSSPMPKDPEPIQVPEDQQNHVPTPKKEANDVCKKISDLAEVTKSAPKEDAKKVSYASIVAKESSLTPPLQASAPAIVRVLPHADRLSSASAPKSSAFPSKTSAPSTNGTPRNGALQNSNVNGEVKSIHIKDLPPNITHEALLEEVNKFGPVKHRNIQLKEYPEDGYRYAFVEFDDPKSARIAIDAGSILFGERRSEIQHKRSSNQGGNFRFRGGLRNDSFRGRDGEGDSNGRFDEYDNRGNYGNYSGRGRGFNNRRNGNFPDQARGSFTGRNGEPSQKGTSRAE